MISMTRYNEYTSFKLGIVVFNPGAQIKGKVREGGVVAVSSTLHYNRTIAISSSSDLEFSSSSELFETDKLSERNSSLSLAIF